MSLFMGLDSSTQSLSALVIDTDTGRVVYEKGINFGADLPEYESPDGVLPSADPLVQHSNPLMWVAAMDLLFSRITDDGFPLAEIAGISGSGQQHGSVYLRRSFLDFRADAASGPLAPQLAGHLSRSSSPIWMDSSTSRECAEITRAVGGAAEVQQRSGSPAVERFTGPQIRKFWKENPAAYAQTGVIHLVSSFLASVLAGRSVGIDPGDGAGMNLLNLRSGDWDAVLLEATATDLRAKLPAAVPADTVAGTIAPYFVRKYGFCPEARILVWSGDNPNSLIGVGGWSPGTAVVSLGTSDTFFAAMPKPRVDPDGYGHVFGNPAGGFMSLICFKNGGLARQKIKDRFSLDWAGFEQCLADTPAGNSGNMILPYFVPEITPLVLDAEPRYQGGTAFVEGRDAAAAIRAVVEAQSLRLKLHSQWMKCDVSTLRVTGGGSVSTDTCQILADIFDATAQRLEVSNSAALGAAMRAANGVGSISWPALTAAFCKPSGSVFRPIRTNVQIYEAALPRYAAFAARYNSSDA